MKKIHLISKTHLDLGFTDYAKNIIERYRNEFIPQAVSLAQELNSDTSDKNFIWTTGSFLINDSLENASEENKKQLDDALKKGYITWHAMPFTTHTELLDQDILEYGLSLSKSLDAKYGKQTIAAKMTDVPGHTKAMISTLQAYGVKLLHIGVNEASAIPDIPQAFLWKQGASEIMVIYESTYGSIYKNEHIDDILYFIHSSDNYGPSSKEKINNIFTQLQNDYPDYEIAFSTLDNYTNELYKVKDKLPVITSEIGDTWIHGVASDPYKTGAYRNLLKLKDKWLLEGKLNKESSEYKNFAKNLLQVAEHTWGMDIKRHFSDYNYLKDDFNAARKKDVVDTHLSLKNFYQKSVVLKYQKKGIYAKGSFKAMENSWQEQRQYIDNAIESLPELLKEQAKSIISTFRPETAFDKTAYQEVDVYSKYQIDGFSVSFGSKGLRKLKYNDTLIMSIDEQSTINYHSYGHQDYEFWRKHYTRNYAATKEWSAPDFLRPGLKYVDKRYLQGVFPYTLQKLYYDGDKSFIAEFTTSCKICWENGAPKTCEIKYSFGKQNVNMEMIWIKKEANRLPEAMFINFPIKIEKDSLRYTKLGQEINPYDVVENGGRNLSCVENIYGKAGDFIVKIENIHAPLVSMGGGKILRFDNEYEDIENKGISFNLHNNIWGTNFPLWYLDNAYFKFVISLENA
ncbi:MAG: DUF5054 domain-containing protein [Clostridiales bacterium]|nr:DUF5054 domain-containing protein [Clostridiales bacterium]